MGADQVSFEEFELDLRAYHLRRSGRSLHLERIPMELLLLLVERHGQLVLREEIVEKLWGKNAFLDTENAINTAIRKIRETLRDNPQQPRFVQTVTGSGYRFIAPVIESSPPPDPAIAVEAAEGHGQLPNRRHLYSLRFVVPLATVLAVSVASAGYLLRRHLFPKSIELQK